MIGKITTLHSDTLASQFDHQSILQEIYKVLHQFSVSKISMLYCNIIRKYLQDRKDNNTSQ